MVRLRDGQHDYVTTARHCIAAAADIIEREVTLIPGNENYRVAVPGSGVHDLTDRRLQKGITGCNELLLIGEAARIETTLYLN